MRRFLSKKTIFNIPGNKDYSQLLLAAQPVNQSTNQHFLYLQLIS